MRGSIVVAMLVGLGPAVLLGCGSATPEDGPGTEPTAPTTPEPVEVGPLVFPDGAPANLLMISVDTLRRDQLARYGGGGHTPFLDGLFAEAVALDDHMTCSNWTYHSTLCTLRGAQPLDWGFQPVFDESGRIAEDVPPGLDYLASWLGDAGFTSLLVTTNALFSHEHRNAEGYDEVMLAPKLGETPASVAGAEALELLDARLASGVDRWFLHLHLMEPHTAYDPPPEYLTGLAGLPSIPYDLTNRDGHNDAVYAALTSLTEEERDLLRQHMETRYAAEVAWLDDQLEALWADLDARGLLDDTLVVVWTDHGEQMFEHGYQTHAWTLHREENDGLLAFWARGLEPAAWDGPTSAVDLVPTLLTLYGQPIPAHVTGLPLGSAPADRARYAEVVAKGGVFQAVRKGPHKLHFGWADPATAPDWAQSALGAQLFDLDADPGEQTDLFSPDDPVSQELWDLLLPRIEALQAAVPEESVHWPEGLPTP